jgi:hypothetical protein
MCCQLRNHNVHTQVKDDEVQLAVTLTPAAVKAEKKNKDTSGGATERIWRDISYPKVTRRSTQIHCFKGLIGAGV